MSEIVCQDCMAHFREGYKHVCPPWLKVLVTRKKEEKSAPQDKIEK
jgi:hypothetical protein